MITLTTTMMADILPLLTAVGGPLHAPVMGLFASNLVPTYKDVVARYTGAGALPTYTGYATTVPTFGAVYQDTDGSLNLQTAVNEFASPSDLTGQTIYGYYITDGTLLLAAETFPVPFVQSVSPQACVFVGSIVLRPGNNNGQCVVLSS